MGGKIFFPLYFLRGSKFYLGIGFLQLLDFSFFSNGETFSSSSLSLYLCMVFAGLNWLFFNPLLCVKGCSQKLLFTSFHSHASKMSDVTSSFPFVTKSNHDGCLFSKLILGSIGVFRLKRQFRLLGLFHFLVRFS